MEETEKAQTIRDLYKGDIKIRKPMETRLTGFQTRLSYYTDFLRLNAGSCEWFERQWLDCASQMGLQRANVRCKNEDDDFKECLTNDKKTKRYERMQEERQKRRVPYMNPPPIDTLNHLKFKSNVFD
jgi:hypothetical protein